VDTHQEGQRTKYLLIGLGTMAMGLLAHRVNAGEDGIVVFPGIFGSPIDPSTSFHDRDVSRLGSGLWNHVLIDATRSWKFERRPEWGNERFPPTVRPAPEDEARVRERWDEYGLGDL
jgi:4-hydroxy-3-polyprenylbenzoate decarboxylase